MANTRNCGKQIASTNNSLNKYEIDCITNPNEYYIANTILECPIHRNMCQSDHIPNQLKRCKNKMFSAVSLHNQRTLLNITLQIQGPNDLSIEIFSPQIIIMTL